MRRLLILGMAIVLANCPDQAEKERQREIRCGLILNTVGSAVRPSNPTMADNLANLSLICLHEQESKHAIPNNRPQNSSSCLADG